MRLSLPEGAKLWCILLSTKQEVHFEGKVSIAGGYLRGEREGGDFFIVPAGQWICIMSIEDDKREYFRPRTDQEEAEDGPDS